MATAYSDSDSSSDLVAPDKKATDDDLQVLSSESSNATSELYDGILSNFLKEMKKVEEADQLDLKREEKVAERMKRGLEKKKKKILEKVDASRFEVGRRAMEAPTPKNPREALARDTYLEKLDAVLSDKEKAGEEKEKDLEFRIALVDKRIQKRRRQSQELIDKLKTQEAIQEAAAKERRENAERQKELDVEALEANLAQGVSPPLAMPAADRLKEKERAIRQSELEKEIRDTKKKYTTYMRAINAQRKAELAARNDKRKARDAAILNGDQNPYAADEDGPTPKRHGSQELDRGEASKSARERKERTTTNKGSGKRKKPRAKLRPDAVATAAYSIAAFVMDYRIESGEIVPDADTDIDLDPLASRDREQQEHQAKNASTSGFVTSYEDVIHEKNLEQAILPDRLRSVSMCSCETHVKVDDNAVRADDATAATNVTKTLAKIAVEQNYKILDRLTLMTRIMHLHSVALLHNINIGKSTRDLVAGGSAVDPQVARLLKEATKATLLSSDADLQAIPFGDIETMMDFCKSRPRVEKMINFLLTYVPYDQHYVMALVNTLFTPELQSKIYWSGTSVTTASRSVPPHAETVPRTMELLIIKVATATHNMAHLNDEEDFDEIKFVKAIRAALYNTKRNVRKRHVVLNQRMVNFLGTEYVPQKKVRSVTEKVSYVFDNSGSLVTPVRNEDNTEDGEKPNLYDALLQNMDHEQSVDEVDELLQAFIVTFEEEPTDHVAMSVLGSIRTAIAAAARDENKAGIVERFKVQLSEIKCRRLI